VSIFDLMEEYEPLPETTRVITPSGGTHLHYAMPEGEPPVRCRVGWLPGVDIPWLVPVPPSAKLVSSIYLPYRFGQQILGPLPEAPSWVFRTSGPGRGNDNDPSAREACGSAQRRLRLLHLHNTPTDPHGRRALALRTASAN
jgi:hypothetical protein